MILGTEIFQFAIDPCLIFFNLSTEQLTRTSQCLFLYFWLRQELKESQCSFVCLSVRWSGSSLSGTLILHHSASGLFQVSLRSRSGPSPGPSLRSLPRSHSQVSLSGLPLRSLSQVFLLGLSLRSPSSLREAFQKNKPRL